MTTVTSTDTRSPLTGDALAAALRAAHGTPLRAPQPMGIRYRDTTAGTRPGQPAADRPTPAQPAPAPAPVPASVELLEDTQARPAKPRHRRTAAAALQPPAAGPQPSGGALAVPEPVTVPESTPVPEASPAMPSTAVIVADQQIPADQQDPAGEAPVEQTHDVPETDDGLETIEQILARAATSPSEQVQAAAAALREQAHRLGQALRIEGRAGGLREQIAVLDAEIAERTARRDALRAELETLLAGEVTVSATAGTVTPGSAPSPGRVRGPRPADVRAWARENGYQVSDKGQIPGGILAAYQRREGSR